MFDAKRILVGGLSVGLILTSAGCGGGSTLLTKQTAENNSRVVARADGGYELTVNQLFDAMSQTMVAPRGGNLTEQEIADIRDSILADTLTGLAAPRQIDLSKHWAYNWTYRFRYNTLLFSTYLEKYVVSQVMVDSADVASFYEQHKDDFRVQEQVEISHIFTNAAGFANHPESTEYKVLSRATLDGLARERILLAKQALAAGMSFKEAAVKFSHDARAKADSGYVGYTLRNAYHPPFDSIAFSLSPGTVSEPYQDVDGWHIIMVHNHLPAGVRPLDHPGVFQSIHQGLMTERIRDRAKVMLDSLAQGVTFTVTDSLLDDNLYDVPDTVTFAVINGIDTVDVLLMRNAEDPIKRQLRVWSTTPEQKHQVLTALVRQFSAIQAARNERLDTLPQVQAQVREIFQETTKDVMRRQWWDYEWKPSDSQIAAYYQENLKQFLVDKPLTVQHIVTKDSTMAIFIRDQARAGNDFIDLAKQYYPGEESIRAELANLGRIGPKDVDTAFYRVAYGMVPGDISDPVKTKYGWHVIKVLKHEDSRSLSDAKVDIIYRLTKENQRRQFKEFQRKLFAEFNVTFPYTVKSAFLEPFAYRRKQG